MNRFIILFDCPLKKCDKIWLYNGLKKYGNVKIVSTLTKKSYFRIGRFMHNFKVGKIMVRIMIYIQTIRAIIISNKNDVIVTWAHNQGYILDNICHKLHIKRKIVSFMWIELPTRDIKKISKSFHDENFIPIINNKSLKNDFINYFKLPKWNGIFLPDVFDDKLFFKESKYKENKYIFAGGVNNRDWNTLINVAIKTPDISYIVVSNKGEIKNRNIKNIKFMENLSTEEYYMLMENAHITICPLKENRVSGLINIIKSSQLGIPCISTKLDVTDIYYSKANKEFLLYEKNNIKDLESKINKLYNLDEKLYLNITTEFQNYIKENFNPNKNIEKLVEELKQKGWIN